MARSCALRWLTFKGIPHRGLKYVLSIAGAGMHRLHSVGECRSTLGRLCAENTVFGKDYNFQSAKLCS
eukprot:5804132-Amphidinium_carterae.3